MNKQEISRFEKACSKDRQSTKRLNIFSESRVSLLPQRLANLLKEEEERPTGKAALLKASVRTDGKGLARFAKKHSIELER